MMVVFLLFSCEENKPPPEESLDTLLSIEKSFKRGLAYNLADTADFSALKNGVSWWYNWHYETSAARDYYSEYEMVFIPMLWGGNTSTTEYNEVKNFILNHSEIEYLLVMNEPNLTDQANQTPARAANDWLIYEQLKNDLANFGRNVALVGPAMNWGTLQGYSDPVVWLDTFYNEYLSLTSSEPDIDYLAFHWYDYGLESQLDRLAKYGKRIWITEMANWNPQINSYQKQKQQMGEMVALCEERDDVYRYAWFIGRGGLPDNHYTYLFEQTPGQLNELGEFYINLPYSSSQ